MIDIEKILQRNSIEDVNVPGCVENKIHYALNHLECKNSKINYLKRIITAFISTIVALLGSVTVYAAFGGTIGGRPVFEWAANIRFSDQYEEYKVEIEGEHITHNKTTMELISTLCDDSYVLLEFDVKLSEEDKHLMKLGENYITEKDFENLEQMEDEKMKQRLFKHYTEYKNDINTFYAEFQDVFINDKEVWLKKLQTVSKISENEYKLYHIFFIADQNWNGKKELKLTLKNCFINTDTIRLKGEYGNYKFHYDTEGSGENFYMDGEINVDVSKEKALENTKIIVPERTVESNYKNLTKTVEKIEITPMQIIIKVSTKIENVNANNFTNLLNMGNNVYDENGEEITSFNCTLVNKFMHNGKEISEGDLYDIKGNSTMHISEIIIIEKDESITEFNIIPKISERIWTEEKGFESIDVKLNPMEVSLNK